jgi:hypothetical protein
MHNRGARLEPWNATGWEHRSVVGGFGSGGGVGLAGGAPPRRGGGVGGSAEGLVVVVVVAQAGVVGGVPLDVGRGPAAVGVVAHSPVSRTTWNTNS